MADFVAKVGFPSIPRSGDKPAGQDPRKANGLQRAATVTLCSYRNASLFWIMLWLVSRPTDHGMDGQPGRLLCAGLSWPTRSWVGRTTGFADPQRMKR